ncbi:MAG: Minf_1886 family protein [Planctomycetota bacterium]
MLDPKHPLAELLRRDQRYEFDAYVFVFDALRFGQEKLGLGEASDEETEEDEEERHVTGAELCRAIQLYAVDQYGMLARPVLNHWGVNNTGDFGEIVFNLIDIGQMRKTDNDRREDFDNIYDFADAFDQRVVFTEEDAVDESE